MSRVLRNQLLYDGCYCHIISRSIRKLKIFNDEEDFYEFKRLLLQIKQNAKFKLFHYCLMQTHFHLVVKVGKIHDFSHAIRDIKRIYAYKFHAKYRLSGPIWRERYKSLLIENEKYLYACGRYIENNPVKAKIVNNETDWLFSSSRHYGLHETDELVDTYGQEVRLKEEIKLNENEFERGSVIGSDFYRFQFFLRLKRSRPVP